jgi:hypothetical protein
MDNPADQFADLRYPLAGVSLLRGFEDQRPVPMQGVNSYEFTTRLARNVRGCEPLTNRLRGGSRPGLKRYIDAQPVAGWIIQNLNVVTFIDSDATT